MGKSLYCFLEPFEANFRKYIFLKNPRKNDIKMDLVGVKRVELAQPLF
jgi:hypothetical protein